MDLLLRYLIELDNANTIEGLRESVESFAAFTTEMILLLLLCGLAQALVSLNLWFKIRRLQKSLAARPGP